MRPNQKHVYFTSVLLFCINRHKHKIDPICFFSRGGEGRRQKLQKTLREGGRALGGCPLQDKAGGCSR